MTEHLTADPVLRALVEDLRLPRLLAAADDGRFGVNAFNYPVVLAWVTVGNRRLGLRLDSVDYPTQPPAGRPWDLDAGLPLPIERWPIGPQTSPVFRPDWSPTNDCAPYLACDRIGLRTHPDWIQQMPERAWNSTRDIFFYLDQIHVALRGATLP